MSKVTCDVTFELMGGPATVYCQGWWSREGLEDVSAYVVMMDGKREVFELDEEQYELVCTSLIEHANDDYLDRADALNDAEKDR